MHGSNVLLIDMDHQSSLSILCLGATKWQNARSEGHTIDEVFKHFIGQADRLPDAEIIFKSPMQLEYDRLDIVPASLRLDNIEIALTASYSGDAVRSEWDKKTMVCRWIEEADVDRNYDYIIFDCPPATKIVSQNAIAASHGYIIPIVPEARVMERGAPHLRDMLRSGIDARLKHLAPMGDARSMYVPDTELLGLVITRIQTHGSYSGYTNDHTQHLKSLRSRWRDLLMFPYIFHGVGVPEALAERRPVYSYPFTHQNIGKRGLRKQYQELTTTIKQRLDTL